MKYYISKLYKNNGQGQFIPPYRLILAIMNYVVCWSHTADYSVAESTDSTLILHQISRYMINT